MMRTTLTAALHIAAIAFTGWRLHMCSKPMMHFIGFSVGPANDPQLRD